jgi:hypothetical protein
MVRVLFVLLFLSPVNLLSQKKYEMFQPGDTATYHIRPGLVVVTGANNLFGVGSYSDTANMDTVYNQLKFLVLSQKRDTTTPVSIHRDTIHQGGKIIGYFASGYPVPSGTCEIRLPRGTLVARCQLNDQQCILTTVFDLKKHELRLTGFYEMQIAEFLIKNGYL